jgi:hypothetical protein
MQAWGGRNNGIMYRLPSVLKEERKKHTEYPLATNRVWKQLVIMGRSLPVFAVCLFASKQLL